MAVYSFLCTFDNRLATLLYRCKLLPLILRNCSVLFTSSCFDWGLWEKRFRRESWSTHFAWNSYMTVYSSLRTLVLKRVTYSSVFVETCGAHTLLGTVTLLFIPASVHLYTDKPAGDLLWTNPRVVWEHPYSDQWELSQYNLHEPRRPITGLEKCQDTRHQTPDRPQTESATLWKPLYFVERL